MIFPFEQYDTFIVVTKDDTISTVYTGYNKDVFDIMANILHFW